MSGQDPHFRNRSSRCSLQGIEVCDRCGGPFSCSRRCSARAYLLLRYMCRGPRKQIPPMLPGFIMLLATVPVWAGSSAEAAGEHSTSIHRRSQWQNDINL